VQPERADAAAGLLWEGTAQWSPLAGHAVATP